MPKSTCLDQAQAVLNLKRIECSYIISSLQNSVTGSQCLNVCVYHSICCLDDSWGESFLIA